MLDAVLLSVPGGTSSPTMDRRAARLFGRRLHDAGGSGPLWSEARVLSSRRNGAGAAIDRRGSGRSIEGRGPWVHP